MIKFLIKLLIGLAILLPVQAEVYNFKILKIIDGDTILIEAPYLPNPLKKSIPLRISQLDTPEKGFRSHCSLEMNKGNLATEFTQNKINSAQDIKIIIEDQDKYFRLLGDVILDGKSLREMLLESELAVPYYGNKKPDWCH